MPHCVFNKCVNHLGQMNKTHGIIFHTFPSNDSARDQWIKIVRIQRNDPGWMPTKYSRAPDTTEESVSQSNECILLSAKNAKEPNIKEEMITVNANKSAHDEVTVVDGNMGAPQDKVEAPDENAVNEVATNIQPTSAIQPTTPKDEPDIKQEKPKDGKTMPLDKFKRRLVRAVARKIQQKKTEEEMWEELKKEIGCDCKMLWQHMRDLTLKKLKRLLPANDFLVNLKKIARFTATDWLLFDLILVHEKVNVININDTGNTEEINKEDPQCLYDLFELVKEHNVEYLSGDDLTEAWIRVTLQYNSSGRQCSPMLLQLRWYQLKELTRARFYNFWYTYRGNIKVLDKAMKLRPTILQAAIAREYKNIITQTYPEWEKLIEDRQVILSEEFTLNREAKRKAEMTREENDIDIEVIEPQVETIELEVDSDEEKTHDDEKTPNAETSRIVEDNNKEITPEANENKLNSENILDNTSTAKCKSEDEVLELDGLSEVEAINIPLEMVEEQKRSENCNVEILTTNVTETLPKITSVIGNLVETNEFTDEQQINTMTEDNTIDDIDDELVEMVEVSEGTENKDTDAIRDASDEEMDQILREKVNNLMNIEITEIKSERDPDNDITTVERKIKASENLQEEEARLNSINVAASPNGNKLTLCDSDDEIDKLLQEKAGTYVSIGTTQADKEKTAEDSKTLTNVSENIIDIEDSNIHVKFGVNEVTLEKETIKKEKQDDGFDEVEFDDDLIEFVDDGIEFVEEIEGDKKKKNDIKIEHLSDSEDESLSKADDDNYSKIDLKLLMNPIVYTKKLDLMDIFQTSGFESVTDRSVIECAIVESKPVDKMALKDEDINKFREQVLRGYETNDTEIDNDVVQTPEEHADNRVKCTSWLLQKPKNRSYNPIQLCKNPDFNTRLKRLTAGFLSSTRNRVLLKECKPLTIDLHKSFEKKLVNGTMYLKSGDFKSAKFTGADKINNEPASVLPSVIPGHNMIFTSNQSISTVVPNKLDNQDDNIPLLSVAEKHTSIERRKIINLPDIDQVRRVNQSLLTAEVTPIRNTNCSKEPIKAPVAEPTFVQPIVLAPLAQIKDEPSQSDLHDKNELQSPLNKSQYENSSNKDLIAHKINDQIVNLSNQISQVDTNDLLSVDVEKTIRKQSRIKNKLGRKPKNHVEKPKTQYVNKLTYVPRYVGELTWSPRYPKNHIADSLLTLDTLSKILFLLNGDEDEIKNNSSKQKRSLKQLHVEHQSKTIDHQNDSQSKQNPNGQGIYEDQSALSKCNNMLKSASENDVLHPTTSCKRRAPIQKIRKARAPSKPKKYYGIYCCWAREKIISITKDKQLNVGRHGCYVYQCLCCCRQELVTIATQENCVPKPSKKLSSTIVLSDDEDKSKGTKISKEVGAIPGAQPTFKVYSENSNLKKNPDTSTALLEQSNNIAVEIVVPPLTSTTETSVNTNSNAFNAKTTTTQSEMCQDNLSIACRKKGRPTNKERDMRLNQISCKTVVHAAGTHAYNKKHVEPIPNIEKETPKHLEHTLFLNSSQILSKPTRAPIYLGKNQILLCSLRNPNVTPTPTNSFSPILPYGVHFVMLPNGELTLSIDHGAQLDSEQLSALPELMSIVQQQYMKSNISNKISEHANTLQENDDVTIVEERNTAVQIVEHSENPKESQDLEDASKKDDNLNISDNCHLSNEQNASTELSMAKLTNKNVPLPLHSEKETSTDVTLQSEVVNTESECAKSIEDEEVAIQREIETTEPVVCVENTENNCQSNEIEHSSDEPCSNDNKESCENKNRNTRKTILSDLMEMSGISAEDTAMLSDVTKPNSPISTLPPSIIPVTKTSESGIDMFNLPSTSSVPEHISIMGPYSNLVSFEPTTPTNHLLNCVGHLRPELNAVTTFAELKYACKYGGQFYKLDVDSGKISEIKVFIKTKPKLQSSVVPKAFIDLTDDVCDNEKVKVKDNEKVKVKDNEKVKVKDNEICAEFHDVPQDKQTEVKPIKLFKAIHPTILKRSGRSILKENEIVYPEKAIRINKERRKQLLNLGDKYVLVDVENKNEPEKAEEPPAGTLDSSYDSSDEEPLAKKCKRTKPVEENVEKVVPMFVEEQESEDHAPAELCDVPGIPDVPDMSGEGGDTSDLDTNTMDIEGVNPELHPVAFEEGSESDEDMCILGV